MPTIRKYPRKSLPSKTPEPKDFRIWEKHREELGRKTSLPRNKDK